MYCIGRNFGVGLNLAIWQMVTKLPILAVLTQTRVHDWHNLGNNGQPRTWLSEVPVQVSTRFLHYTCHLMTVAII